MRVPAAAIRFNTKVKTHFSVSTFRLVISAALVPATLGMLSACGSSNPSHLAYVAGGQGVSAYRINNRSGNAAAILGSPFVAGNSPSSVVVRSEEHTSELQSHLNLVCRLLLEKKKPRHHTSASLHSPPQTCGHISH